MYVCVYICICICMYACMDMFVCSIYKIHFSIERLHPLLWTLWKGTTGIGVKIRGRSQKMTRKTSTTPIMMNFLAMGGACSLEAPMRKTIRKQTLFMIWSIIDKMNAGECIAKRWKQKQSKNIARSDLKFSSSLPTSRYPLMSRTILFALYFCTVSKTLQSYILISVSSQMYRRRNGKVCQRCKILATKWSARS